MVVVQCNVNQFYCYPYLTSAPNAPSTTHAGHSSSPLLRTGNKSQGRLVALALSSHPFFATALFVACRSDYSDYPSHVNSRSARLPLAPLRPITNRASNLLAPIDLPPPPNIASRHSHPHLLADCSQHSSPPDTVASVNVDYLQSTVALLSIGLSSSLTPVPS